MAADPLSRKAGPHGAQAGPRGPRTGPRGPEVDPLRLDGVEGSVVDCTAIVVAYNSAADLPGLLDSLPRAAAGLSFRVLVVDNDSDDDVAPVLAGRVGVTLVRSGANLGYAGGINAGRARLGPTRTIAILNPDLRLAPASLTRLVAAAIREGAAVPRFVDEAGATFPSLRREPSIARALGDALLGRRWPGRPGAVSEMVWDRESYQRSGAADWATGAVLVVAAGADATIGDWDERFFLYSEETDYCRRLRAAGWRVQYVPEAQVIHRGAGSGTGPALTALNEVNRVRYYRKYHGPVRSAVFRAAVMLNQLMRARRAGNRAALHALASRRHRGRLPGPSATVPGPRPTAARRDTEFAG
jgi:GT2 family glycosyltransferase